ncbi:hypothetical protein ACFSMW_01955 [Virgibacillus halophilus]|uniref:hypothetical protein n=1 Tax=Tigheibacillus halophilus TaxID=361280 RepID=UPI003636238C
MQMDVHNWYLDVCNIQVNAVATSSVFLVGDNESFQLSSLFDTPPESYPLQHIVPLSPLGVTGAVTVPGVTGVAGGAAAGAGAGVHGR